MTKKGLAKSRAALHCHGCQRIAEIYQPLDLIFSHTGNCVKPEKAAQKKLAISTQPQYSITCVGFTRSSGTEQFFAISGMMDSQCW
ncbi:MAG: hypothetical protein SV429_12125 [Pseudomonadota bacterium]|nr:hypothetical protein [Pseudomonadota bacterium]